MTRAHSGPSIYVGRIGAESTHRTFDTRTFSAEQTTASREKHRSRLYLFTRIIFPLALFSLLFGACSPTTITNVGIIRNRISTLMELHSYEFLYREILYFGDRQTLLGFIPTRDRQFLFRVDYTVTAGIDLQDGLDVSIVPGAPDRIRIRLPLPEIVSVDAGEDTIHQYLNQTFGGEMSILEMGDMLDLAAESVSEDAVSRGILTFAKREAEYQILALLSGLGIGDAEVVWGSQP